MTVTAVHLGGRPDQPLLVLGPSLGTSATTLWSATAEHLTDHFHVIAWDLPGHGTNASVPETRLSMVDLARDVLDLVDDVRDGAGDVSFHYAGDSVGGAVGLQLLLDAPERIISTSLLCTGARIGTPESWRDRASSVRTAGTTSLVAASAERWFAPGFVERHSEESTALLDALAATDDAGYAAVCAALEDFDVRDRLAEVSAPTLVVAGESDLATPPDVGREIAEGVTGARLEVLPGVAHLAPAEAPEAVARLIGDHALRSADGRRSRADVRAAGMTVRREVLGDAHVDRATAGITDLTRDFQEMITEYAWGGIWTRPGLDRRSRSMITLTALIARGHHDELAMHVRAARRNGLTVDEITEVILQSAIYCGVPDANTAFRIAGQVLAEET